jgi:hypothetical protein
VRTVAWQVRADAAAPRWRFGIKTPQQVFADGVWFAGQFTRRYAFSAIFLLNLDNMMHRRRACG